MKITPEHHPAVSDVSLSWLHPFDYKEEAAFVTACMKGVPTDRVGVSGLSSNSDTRRFPLFQTLCSAIIGIFP